MLSESGYTQEQSAADGDPVVLMHALPVFWFSFLVLQFHGECVQVESELGGPQGTCQPAALDIRWTCVKEVKAQSCCDARRVSQATAFCLPTEQFTWTLCFPYFLASVSEEKIMKGCDNCYSPSFFFLLLYSWEDVFQPQITFKSGFLP